MGQQLGQQIGFALRQSMQRIILMMVKFLPGIIAFLLALILLGLIGWGLSVLLRRVLTALHFDDRLASHEAPGSPVMVADWSRVNSPTRLASRIVFWACIFLGIAVGLSAFDASYSAGTHYSIFLLPYVAHLTGAILILIAGTLLARFLARTVLIGAVNAQLQYARFLSHGIKWLVIVFTGAMALDHLEIGGGVVELAFGILFGGIVLTLSLAIGLGSRDLVSRSIEKNIEKTTDRPVSIRPTEVTPITDNDPPPRPKLRHF